MPDIRVDTRDLTRFLNDFEKRQVPFALSKALNDTAALFQYRQRQHMASIFTIRRKAWVDQSVKITQFASKRSLVATVAIESPGGGQRSDVLGKFETQRQKRPHGGGQSIAVPVEARRSKSDIITASNRPKAFNFREVHGPKDVRHLKNNVRGGVLRGALKVFEGDRRTVMIRNAQGAGVILQRMGKGKRAGMRLLFRLTPRVAIKPDLRFVATAREAGKHFKDFFAARFAEAMTTAKQ